MIEEIWSAIKKARELVTQNTREIKRTSAESRRSDQAFQTTYDRIQRDLAILRRAWR